ncbi:MAG: glycosyltransferase family 39 protein [Candidatus Bathyarchaeota archaeon]|nr:MAG: glycosyltransferase family 39 protein [Candidatus Bathyarchaeota archaeon]
MANFEIRDLRIAAYVTTVMIFLFTTFWAVSSWTPIYLNLHPLVSPFYFVASALMFLIVLDNHLISSVASKIRVVVAHSFLTRILSTILFYPGTLGDPFYHLMVSRTWFNTGIHYMNFSPFPVPEISTAIGRLYVYHRAATQHSLIVILSRMLGIDVYWVHLCLVGVLWSLFLPIVAFKTARTIGASNRVSLLAAVLMANAPILMGWSFIPVPNSLGFIFFAVSIYFSAKLVTSEAKRKYGFLAFSASMMSLLTHSMTGFVAIAMLLLAFSLLRYEDIRKNETKRAGLFVLLLGLAISIVVLPVTTIALQIVYPIKSSLSLSKFLDLGIHEIILTHYSDYSFLEGIMFGLPSFLAIIGIVLKRKSRRESMAKIFLALAFISVVAQYRIFLYFVDPSPFGEHRLLVFIPFVIAPLAAVTIDHLFDWLALPKTITPPENIQPESAKENPSKRTSKSKFTLRQGLATLLISISLSAFFAQATLAAWEEIGERSIPMISIYSMEAAELIHEEYLRTGERYVVVSDKATELAGAALVGRYNPNEYYMLSLGAHPNRILFMKAIQDISVEPMFEAAERNDAVWAYLAFPRWAAWAYLGPNANYESIVDELGKFYETFAVLGDGDGEIHIFRYRVPWNPFEGPGPSVTVLLDSVETHMNTTSTYLLRNNVTYTLNVTGASTYNITQWPLLWSYESIEPTPAKTSIDANAWINFTGSPVVTYTVKWIANEFYSNVVWKDDAFFMGESLGEEWYYYSGKANYTFTTDGDILEVTAEGIPRDYILFDKQLPHINGSLSLLARIMVREGTTCYIELWDDTLGKIRAFFSYAIKTGGEFTTVKYLLPKDYTFTRIRLDIQTPDGSPCAFWVDYIMIFQT